MMSMAEVDSMVTGLGNIGDVGDDDDEDDEDLSDIDDDDLLGELEVCETEHLTCCCSLTILCVLNETKKSYHVLSWAICIYRLWRRMYIWRLNRLNQSQLPLFPLLEVEAEVVLYHQDPLPVSRVEGM